MTEKVRSKIDIHLPESTSADDDWAQFRQVERVAMALTQSYKYSLGKVSRFFMELENGRFLATRCDGCAKVFAPPRPLCPSCLAVADWVELSGQGVVKTYSVLHFSPGSNDDVRALQTPYVLAYVLLDGADTLFPHLLKAPPDQVHSGLRVRVAYSDEPVHHPIHLMYFVPVVERQRQ
ncbi:MAG: Zn-ribbon domain-containing OB-fold protein [Chloroflexi bacterium]|nr:Zn-ribbon domain-containing OB-fold protein [Chloroflexota bacterium]